MKKYEYLKKIYPEYINGDSLHKICRISKKNAHYLLEHEIIPSINTGKKTWRYKIALQDVINYLNKRDAKRAAIPPGMKRCYKVGPRESFANIVPSDSTATIRKYFLYIYDDFPDVLRLADVCEMTGLCGETILRYLRRGDIKAFMNKPHYLFPKIYVLDFVSSPNYINCKSNSKAFKKILGGYKLWKAAK